MEMWKVRFGFALWIILLVKLNCAIKAPKSVTVNPRTSSSLDVVVVAPNDASEISRYEAVVVGDPSKACTITSLDKPECQLEGLEAGTVYVV
uniref:Fibronectin type-III domain-containing protein n=1 Tax=Mesocestoides corti TaxID=53468 RepID=A0A5K3FTX9_MESCO